MLAALLPLASGLAMANADDYPSKPVTMIVPFAAGGMVDASARIMAEKLGDVTGQRFIVENRPGASGSIGYAGAARSEPDGYTVLVGYSTTSTCSPAIFPSLNWKPEDLTPVGSFAEFPLVVTIHPSIPANNLGELISYLKAHLDEVNYGSVGVGSQVHIASELFKKVTGTDLAAVQYKGSGEVIAHLLAGNVQFVFDAYGPYRQHVESGALKALAVANGQRDPDAPNIPTAAEQGTAGLEQIGFMPLYLPAQTDPAIVATLAKAVETAAKDPDLQKVTGIKLTNAYRGSEELKTLLAKMTGECADIVKTSGITLQ